jgi:hypothetical protein
MKASGHNVPISGMIGLPAITVAHMPQQLRQYFRPVAEQIGAIAGNESAIERFCGASHSRYCDLGIHLARCGRVVTVPPQVAKIGDTTGFRQQFRRCHGAIWPIVARLRQQFRAGDFKARPRSATQERGYFEGLP